ncbi:MAG TPA: ABC transporter permease subunit [Dehalococcoidia bacterium]|nr:ABC transporter permease subunit [Dehalococcoidia bacterium]
MQVRVFPARQARRRRRAPLADLAVALGVLVLLALVARVGADAFVHFSPPNDVPRISLDPLNLPYYAARSTLRMFVALGCSLGFTLLYGYAAARSRRAERVLLPLLDILQSVPVLGFLSITVTAFIALFPGSLLGLELASVFAIFTSQAWNMTFSFYQSLITLPHDLDEAARLYRLPAWQRFTRLEVPAATVNLIWNMMMSFGGGWFFVAASEAISVLNKNYQLPGIGSYVAIAIERQDLGALAWALAMMALVIVTVDQLFWRPLAAWADRFKLERSSAAEAPRSWLLDLLRTARLPQLLGGALAPIGDRLDALLSRVQRPAAASGENPGRERLIDGLYTAVLLLLIAALAATGVRAAISNGVDVAEVGHVALLGLATFARVLVLLVAATLIWTPVGVAIGFNPRLARLAQPVALLLASFPANFLFPLAAVLFIHAGISLNWGGILLMALGAQWYILFNTIAGAMSIPADLRDMATSMRLRGWRLWRDLIIPGIFPSWVTGGITAAGGAWNASIVAEVVSWGDTTLTATGLGAYIADATGRGDWPQIVLGVAMMSAYVVGLNRLVWRRLYRLAESRYRLS